MTPNVRPPSEPVTFKYRAFLSYSHRDASWAKWLYAALEGYPIDKDLVGRKTAVGAVPKALRPIFRDREDFSAGHSLTEQTEAALAGSQFMIVLCSPNAAKSQYVNEEIRRFKALGRGDRVIPLIVAGEPGDPAQECFPEALRFKVGPDGALTGEREEPIAADARPQGDGKPIAKIKLIAGLLGVGFDEIVRREERARKRRHRIWGAIAATFIFLAVTATGSAVYAFNKLVESEENLDHAVEFAYGFVSEAAAEADRYGVSVETTLKLLRRAEQALDSLISSGRDTPQLRYRRALMLLSFAETYQKLGESQTARERAELARAQLAALTAQHPDRLAWQRDLAIAHNRLGDILGEQGAIADALASYRAALDLLQRLTARQAQRRDWQLDLARTFEKIGNALSDQGSLSDALTNYRQALEIADRVAKAEPENPDAQQVLSIAHQRVGYVLANQGALAEALDHYRQSLAIRQRLVTVNPENTRWQRELLALHNEIGDALRTSGSLADALAEYRKGLAIAERLATSDPKNAQWQRELTVSYLRIGDVLLKQRELNEALASYRAGLAIAERLAANDTRNINWLRDVAIWHDRVARVLEEQEKYAEALESYRKSLTITERVAKADPANAVWQRDLALAYSRLGELFVARAMLKEALEAFRTSLTLTERLAGRDTSNMSLQRDIAVLYARIALVFRNQKDFAQALAEEQKGLAIFERLAAASPTDNTLQRDLLVSHNNIGDTLVALGKPDEAAPHYHAALRIAERLAAADPENVQWQLDLVSAHLHLAILGDDRINHLRSAAEILRKLKAAGKLTAQQEGLLTAIEAMLAQSGAG